jgi:hypothetical protein
MNRDCGHTAFSPVFHGAMTDSTADTHRKLLSRQVDEARSLDASMRWWCCCTTTACASSAWRIGLAI